MYYEAEFERQYPLKAGDFAAQPLRGSYPQLEGMLTKLAAGRPVTIATLGGSFTAGHDCSQRAQKRSFTVDECSWPARFLRWLETAFPGAQITYQGWNRGGTASCPHLVMLPILLQSFVKDQVLDLVILDTLVNGNLEADRDRYCYEGIVRTLHELTPGTAIFSLLAGPPAHLNGHGSAMPHALENMLLEEKVLLHYGIPFANTIKLGLSKPKLWTIPRGNPFVHPSWQTHQIVADLVSNQLGRVFAAASGCTARSEPVDPLPWPKATFFDASVLAKYEPCLHPVSSYDAFSKSHWNGLDKNATPRVLRGKWDLFEDRPGKPGWISRVAGSAIQFDVTFGPQPNLLIAYLRSYKGLGRATVSVKLSKPYQGHDHYGAALDGLWKNKVSQVAIHRVVEGFQPGFFLPPNEKVTVEIANAGAPKFKIVGVYSC